MTTRFVTERRLRWRQLFFVLAALCVTAVAPGKRAVPNLFRGK